MPKTRTKTRRVKGSASRGRSRRWKWVLIVLVVLLLIPAMQVAVVRFINPPWTLPMLIDQGSAMFSSTPKPPLRYHWIGLPEIPEMFLEHLWISEDQRFFQHEGFDWKEMHLAVKEAKRKGKPVRGASTITNQCARSIFLWQGRSWIRKGLESYYTIWMEALLPKRRILELYANVIEMGRGIYGSKQPHSIISASTRVVLRGSSLQCWRRSCRIRKAGTRRIRAGPCDGVSGAFCNVNETRISPKSCFIDRVNRFAPRGFGLTSNHVSARFYVVKGFASRGLGVLS
jgi:monofunctional biosynthetic peptidoglycan transglycosylase